MSDVKESKKSHFLEYRHSCINCMHCHLFHKEKNSNRYYCQPPGKQPLFLSQPHVRRFESCEHYVSQHHVLSSAVTSLCDRILNELLKRNTGSQDFDYLVSFFSRSLSHDLHGQLYDILEEIIQWEMELTNTETSLSIRFYFELATHAIMRIIHLQGDASFESGKLGLPRNFEIANLSSKDKNSNQTPTRSEKNLEVIRQLLNEALQEYVRLEMYEGETLYKFEDRARKGSNRILALKISEQTQIQNMDQVFPDKESVKKPFKSS